MLIITSDSFITSLREIVKKTEEELPMMMLNCLTITATEEPQPASRNNSQIEAESSAEFRDCDEE